MASQYYSIQMDAECANTKSFSNYWVVPVGCVFGAMIAIVADRKYATSNLHISVTEKPASLSYTVRGPARRTVAGLAAADITYPPQRESYEARGPSSAQASLSSLSVGTLAIFSGLSAAVALLWHLVQGKSAVAPSAAPLSVFATTGHKFNNRPSFALQATSAGNPAEAPLPPTGTQFDMVVIGAGPGGEAAAVLAGQLGAKTLVLEQNTQFGGPTGLTSKAVRHAVKQILATCDSLGGDRETILKQLWKNYPELLRSAEGAQASESKERLQANKVQMTIIENVKIAPDGSHVVLTRGDESSVVDAKYVIIATGSRPARPASIPFKPNYVVDSTEIAQYLCRGIPDAIGILGGGVIGVEYALVLASVGVRVMLFTSSKGFLSMLPDVLRNEVMANLKENKIELIFDRVDTVEPGSEDSRCKITCGDKVYECDVILHSQGRDGNSQGLGLEEAGVKIGKYGRIEVDENNRTSVPNVFAVGDVAGTGLASAASKAGRGVAKFVLQGITEEDAPELFGERVEDLPVTLWTVPEMATVGSSLEQLTEQGLLPASEGGPVVVGTVNYADLVQGRLAGGVGFVQVVAKYDAETKEHKMVGAHILGTSANDLIQVCAMLIHTGCSLELVANTPWAAVTMSALLQHAADDALSKSPFVEVKRVSALSA